VHETGHQHEPGHEAIPENINFIYIAAQLGAELPEDGALPLLPDDPDEGVVAALP